MMTYHELGLIMLGDIEYEEHLWLVLWPEIYGCVDVLRPPSGRICAEARSNVTRYRQPADTTRTCSYFKFNIPIPQNLKLHITNPPMIANL